MKWGLLFSAVLLVLIIWRVPEGYTQGCSDAGLCTFSINHAESAAENLPNQISAGLSYGRSTDDVQVLTPYVSYLRHLRADLSLSTKVTFASVDGGLGSNAGLGDFYVSLSYSFSKAAARSYAFSAGIKIPLNRPDAVDGDLVLPMEYQSSLGTYDIILDASIRQGPWGVVLGFQQPLNTAVNNEFIAAQSALPEARYYTSTNKFTRKADILARLFYDLTIIAGRLSVRPSILPIYHLGTDTYIDAQGDKVEITGSQGLTLNGSLFVNYQVSDHHFIEFSVGSPFITRDVRPDGLTREVVLDVKYSIHL